MCWRDIVANISYWGKDHRRKSLPPDGEDMGGYIQINKQTNNTSLRKYLSWKEILNNLSWCCSSLPLFNILSCCHLRGEENNLANWEPLWSPKKSLFWSISDFTFYQFPSIKVQKQILSNLLFVFFCTFSVSVCHQKLGGPWK